jgi:hypothetical protein
MIRNLLQAALCAILCPALAAQEVAPQTPASAETKTEMPAAATAEPAQVPEFVTIPKNTEIWLVEVDSVSSATAKKGQPVRIEVSKDLVIDGRVVIPKGLWPTASSLALKKRFLERGMG